MGTAAARAARLQARRSRRRPQARRHHAHHAGHRRSVPGGASRRLIPELVSAARRLETSCRDVGRSIPRRSLHHGSMPNKCVMNLGRVAREAPSCGGTCRPRRRPCSRQRHLKKHLATSAIRRRTSSFGKGQICHELPIVGRRAPTRRWQKSTNVRRSTTGGQATAYQKIVYRGGCIRPWRDCSAFTYDAWIGVDPDLEHRGKE